MDKFNRTYFAVVVIATIIALMINLTQAAPKFPHPKRHLRYVNDDDHRKMEWVNPCRGKYVAPTLPIDQTNEINQSSGRERKKILVTLQKELQNYIVRLNGLSNAIDTHDISTWFKHNKTFEFLPRINVSIAGINLQKWHKDIQIYVGAFQHLHQKQKRSERQRNDITAKSSELKSLMVIARNSLCEIETAINSTWHKMPDVFSRQAMDNKLTFRNNNSGPTSDDVDDLDIKFTKIRFIEYLHSQHAVMERPRRRLRKNNKAFALKSGSGKKKINAQRAALRRQRQQRKQLEQRQKQSRRKNLRKSITKIQRM